MSVGITLDELLVWNREASGFWKDYLGKNPAVLELPCGIERARRFEPAPDGAKFGVSRSSAIGPSTAKEWRASIF